MEYSRQILSEYDQRAEDFLHDSGTTMTIEFDSIVHGFPFEDEDSNRVDHKKYNVTLTRGEHVYRFPFYDSYHNFKNDIKPRPYDVLACLQKSDVGEMKDFVEEFGYEIKDRKSFERVENIWKACKDEYQNLYELFGEEWMEKLWEID